MLSVLSICLAALSRVALTHPEQRDVTVREVRVLVRDNPAKRSTAAGCSHVATLPTHCNVTFRSKPLTDQLPLLSSIAPSSAQATVSASIHAREKRWCANPQSTRLGPTTERRLAQPELDDKGGGERKLSA
jgi:hypothetical protein